jgi:hypothetical protein
MENHNFYWETHYKWPFSIDITKWYIQLVILIGSIDFQDTSSAEHRRILGHGTKGPRGHDTVDGPAKSESPVDG